MVCDAICGFGVLLSVFGFVYCGVACYLGYFGYLLLGVYYW